MKKKRELDRLKKGKQYHKKIQKEWIAEATGDVRVEKRMQKLSGKKGRMDVFVQDGEDRRLVGIGEIKFSDWDRMNLKALKRNVRRQIKQIWDYIDSHLKREKDVSAGVIFPKRPKDDERTKLIEELFNNEAIQVVWEDDSVMKGN
jgi:hypothetical protein